MKKVTVVVLWALQIMLAGLVLMAGWGKLSGVALAVDVFTALGMEPFGRYLIGVLEMIGVVFLLVPWLVTSGALLIFAIMLGAGLAHFTVLGTEGLQFYVPALVLSVVILYLRRKKLPLFGKTM